jgi:hypothetical protein
MLRRVLVAEPGDSPFLPGERVDARVFAEVNRGLVQEQRRPAEGRPELMGITKASLATDSWLSAASFQETTRVLTEAAIEGRSDHLFGLKENIIIGKLIPAGSGMGHYRDIEVDLPEAAGVSLRSYGYDEETEDLAAWLRDVGGSSSDVVADLGIESPRAEQPASFPWGVTDAGTEPYPPWSSGEVREVGEVGEVGEEAVTVFDEQPVLGEDAVRSEEVSAGNEITTAGETVGAEEPEDAESEGQLGTGT